ncbi:hypothetical protein [Thalassotalea sediminis]|uniref:hypothetical protein n=1 Tax=Thalassotalea sediminis TaxID=1759089 RepID=UPI00257319E6|nr:hypothetical protein [Thalassotalea sediminis]
MKINSKILFSFSIYGSGILAFFLADLYVVAHFSPTVATDWAFYKSALFILTSFSVLGLDQVIVRHPNISKNILYQFLINSISIGIVSYSIFVYLSPVTIEAEKLVCSIFLLSYITLSAAVFRANRALVYAQVATNGWKILTLAFIVFTTFETDHWFLLSLFIFAGITTLTLLISKLLRQQATQRLSSQHDLRHLGYSFFFHNMTLVVAIYGEQLIINALGYQKVAYTLYAHFVIFTPLALSLYGFFGFYLAPKIRHMTLFSIEHYHQYMRYIGLISFVLSLVSIFIGFLLYQLIFIDKNIQLQPTIIGSLFIVCLARGCYTLSSSCLGLFATQKKLSYTAKLNWLLMLFYLLCLYITLISTLLPNNKMASIALLTAVHWCCRTYISHKYAKLAIQRKVIS